MEEAGVHWNWQISLTAVHTPSCVHKMSSFFALDVSRIIISRALSD